MFICLKKSSRKCLLYCSWSIEKKLQKGDRYLDCKDYYIHLALWCASFLGGNIKLTCSLIVQFDYENGYLMKYGL